MAHRVFFYVQHLLGIGHVRRSERIARAMDQAGLDVHFVFGGASLPGMNIGGAKLHQLPPVHVDGTEFSKLLDENGKEIDDIWRKNRAQNLLSLFHSLKPDILLLEMFPFGRRQFRFELLPLLEEAWDRQARPVIACSVRDILVEGKRPERAIETVEILRRYFSLVLVHADPSFVTFDKTFPLAREIEDLIAYTGFVGEDKAFSPDRIKNSEDGEVLVSAGGGAVGYPLLQAAIEAKALTRYSNRRWRLLTGPSMAPEKIEALRWAAKDDPDILIESFREDFSERLRHCALSISQGGYNTMLEIAAAGCRSVIVPFADKGESEQTLRASLFAAKGVTAIVQENDLNPVSLARAIDRAPLPPALPIDMKGAANSAAILRSHALRERRLIR